MATDSKNTTASVTKKAVKTSLKCLRTFSKQLLNFVIGIISFLIMLFDALASIIWLPLVYLISAETAAKIIYKKRKNNKLEYIHATAMYLCGFIWWDWFIKTSLCPPNKRIAFIDAQQRYKYDYFKLTDYSRKQQIEYWLAKKDYLLLQKMSKDAAMELFEISNSIEEKRNFIKVLGLTPEILKNLFKSYDDEEVNLVYEKGNEVKNTTLGLYSIMANTLKGFRQMENTCYTGLRNLGCFINAFGYNNFSPICITSEEEEELWASKNEYCRKLVLHKRVLKAHYLNSMVSDKQFELLRYAIETITPSSKQIEWLIDMAPSNVQLEKVLFDFIVSYGLDIKILKKVYDARKKIAPKLQEAVDIHEEIVLIRGFKEGSEKENLEFWKKYIDQNKKVTPTAQVQMKIEHFRIFSEAGLKLESAALEDLIVNINDQAYFEFLLEKEFKNLTPQMVALIKAKPWKYNLYMNEKAKRKAN